MCRCSAKRKYILIWTPESEMKEAISRVEKRGEELNDANAPPICNDDFENTASHSNDQLAHQTEEVSCNPICSIDSVPELVHSDDSVDDVSIEPKKTKNGLANSSDGDISNDFPVNETAAVINVDNQHITPA